MPTKEAIRQRLVTRRRELMARYRGELERIEEELATRQAETVEQSSEQWDAEVLSKLGDADLRAIVAVMEALARLDAGTYGRCAQCAQPIGTARLMALPETVICIDCATDSLHVLARSA
ncbi:MAG: TraR/DksA C4-type zinc finger protein [Myxococcales bacterium]|nr:TraR/DksA C4-type zinc finger protein [Myxococcales bacterium]